MFGNIGGKMGYAPMQPNQMQTGYQPNMQTIQPVGNTAIANPVSPPMQTTQPFPGWNGGQVAPQQMQTTQPFNGWRGPQAMQQQQPMAYRPQSLLGRPMVR